MRRLADRNGAAPTWNYSVSIGGWSGPHSVRRVAGRHRPVACSTQIGISKRTLSAKSANEALVPPIARQACRLDHKPKTAITATPHDQVCAPRRHFVIRYSSFHTFWPKLIGSSLFCIMVATWFGEALFLSRERWCNGLGRFEIDRGNLLGWRKVPFPSSARHLCRVLVDE